MRLVLASQSASRRALLEAAGLTFEALPAAVDEATIKESARAEGMAVAEAATLLADAKAARIARKHPEAVIIGADQILVCEEEWFEKPEDVEGARAHLRRLRNRPHELVTAVVVWREGERAWHHVARPKLVMRDFSDAFLDDYLAREGGFVTQSVGAYRLEGLGLQLMRDIKGEHTAILGLPMLPLLAYLRDSGVIPA
ncbi:Maf family protein [Roseococcus suduntuyensis]|uniref:Nucleoside triphosphate pyrophosphatase n=1 Tax=Roseococcus suduntuyensis TaxID=455361 RepID=A0A840A6H6_9PROT|nr:nucleoside triphosphate pyrophosphatase [Roseococcus suduntuyensis]MBB3897119.1 septum formation protein [Roseococcus suduntuyensis]